MLKEPTVSNLSESAPSPVAAPTDGEGPHARHSQPVPDTSLLPGSEKAPTPAVSLMNRAVQGAHDTIDRLADGAAPTVQRLGDRLSGAQEAIHAQAEQLRQTRDSLSASLRGTVRSNPLLSVTAALVLGALIARLGRSR